MPSRVTLAKAKQAADILLDRPDLPKMLTNIWLRGYTVVRVHELISLGIPEADVKSCLRRLARQKCVRRLFGTNYRLLPSIGCYWSLADFREFLRDER